uniref:Helix-turn-helix n=1 Tax=Candidatus Kentrum sp. SD TaxID=2126332 RepID=A0A450YXD1_9GAMM|nr:MAG: hypothetical protein BECKSD772F_GA0070984_12811 [Candidatus Kentron sp. SD]
MRKIREILRLKHEAKLSHGKIASALGISKGVVTNAHEGRVPSPRKMKQRLP